MMQPGGKFDRELMRARFHECPRNLCRSWKRICSYSAGAQFVAEGSHVLIGIVLGQRCDSFFGFVWRSFPKYRQIANDLLRLL